MFDITPPIIKTILLSFGYDHVQTLPINTQKPTSFHVVLNKADVNWRAPIIKHLKEFESVFGAVTFGNTNKKTHNPECDYIEVGKFRIFAGLKEHKVITVPAGKNNELVFFNTLMEYLGQYDPLNIEFHSENKRFFVPGVDGISHVAHDTTGRKKADINLIGSFSGDYSLSLKEPKFAAWGAVETYWKDKTNVLEYALDNMPSKVTLDKIGNEYSLSRSIAVKASANEAKDVIFGSDILGKGLVLPESWKSKHFDWDDRSRTLTLECEDIIHAMSDVSGDLWPYFQLRNHKGHKSKFLSGIAANAIPFSNLSSNDIIIPNVARTYVKKEKSNAA